VASALEEFLTDWMVRSLAADTTRFRRTQEDAAARRANSGIESWLAKEFGFQGDVGTVVTVAVTLAHGLIPSRPTIEASRGLLHVQDDVLEFPTANDFQSQAMNTLESRFQRRVNRLTDADRAVMNATRSIRNAVAHASAGAVQRMNAAIRSPLLSLELRVAGPIGRDGIGRYLCQAPLGQPSERLLLYLDALKELAFTLEPRRGRRPSMLRT
jgi:hypothetical protein